MTRWPRYPEYRDSGVEWLGEIPKSWETRRLKYAAEIDSGALAEDTDPNYVLQYVDIGNVDSQGNILDVQEMSFEKAPSRARRQVRDGDTIISTVRTYLKAIAYIENPPDNLIVSTGFAVLRPRPEVEPKYLWRLVQSQGFVDAVVANSEGIGYPAIAPTKLAELPVWIPPLPEQHAIAAFLDLQTAKIDALIAEQRRIIELLQERRAALISNAVTKGLDPDVSMKDSGISWLGGIPRHWQEKRLKFITVEPLKYGANEAADITDPELPRFIRITDINEDGTLRHDTFRSLPEDIAAPYLLEPGDILLARSGATVGKSFMYQESWGRACYAGYLIRFRPNQEVALPEFVFYFLNSRAYWNWISSVLIQATIENVSAEKYSSLLVPIAPLSEQRAVASYLDRETAKIDALIAEIETNIAHLEEYRTALISATVTGKIDVRDALPPDVPAQPRLTDP